MVSHVLLQGDGTAHGHHTVGIYTQQLIHKEGGRECYIESATEQIEAER